MGLCLRADLGSGKSEVCLQRRELGGGQRRVAREQLQRGVVGALAEPTRVTCPPSRLEPGRPLGGRRVLGSGPEIWLSPPPSPSWCQDAPTSLGPSSDLGEDPRHADGPWPLRVRPSWLPGVTQVSAHEAPTAHCRRLLLAVFFVAPLVCFRLFPEAVYGVLATELPRCGASQWGGRGLGSGTATQAEALRVRARPGVVRSRLCPA